MEKHSYIWSIAGLRSRPDLNGLEAVVVGTQGARQKVRVLGTDEVVALKSENLRREGTCVAVCDGCGKSFAHKEVMYCARCKSRTYCSKACQARVWPEHKLVCRQLARERDEERQGGVGADSATADARRAQDRLFEGKTESAKKYIAKALAADPENLNARLQKATMLSMEGDYAGAIPIWEAVLAQDLPSDLKYNPGAFEFNLGNAYFHRNRPGDQQRAIEYLLDSWAANPNDSNTANLIGVCYGCIFSQSRAAADLERAAADLDEAERWSKRAYELDKNDPRAKPNSAYNLAQIYFLKNNPAPAIPLLEAVLSTNPQDVRAKPLLDKARTMALLVEGLDKVRSLRLDQARSM